MYSLTIEVSLSEVGLLDEAATVLIALIPYLANMIDVEGLDSMSINAPGRVGTGTITLSKTENGVSA